MLKVLHRKISGTKPRKRLLRAEILKKPDAICSTRSKFCKMMIDDGTESTN